MSQSNYDDISMSNVTLVPREEDETRQQYGTEANKSLPIASKEAWKSSFVHKSFFTYDGPVIWIHNTSCQFANTSIGGLRLPAMDLHKIPAYLEENGPTLKNAAIAQLQRHLLRNASPIGAGETIISDEYGMSYTVASLTDVARQLCHGQKFEAPLFACFTPSWVQQVPLSYLGNNVYDCAYVLHAYISLLPLASRRRELLRKQYESKIKEQDAAVSVAAPAKKPKPEFPRQGGPGYQNPNLTQNFQKRTHEKLESLETKFESIDAKLDRNNRLAVAATLPQYPALSGPQPPLVWVQDDDSVAFPPAS